MQIRAPRSVSVFAAIVLGMAISATYAQAQVSTCPPTCPLPGQPGGPPPPGAPGGAGGGGMQPGGPQQQLLLQQMMRPLGNPPVMGGGMQRGIGGGMQPGMAGGPPGARS